MYQNTAKFYGFFYDGSTDAVRRSEFVASFLENSPARIIDVSAGVGDLAFPLATKGHEVACFEPCDTMYAVLLDRFKARKDIRHLVSPFPVSIEGFPIRLEADMAVASNLFSHLDGNEKRSYMRAVHAQLRTGGTFLFNCIQQTTLRPDQPMAEINKKVFGAMALRHFASSIAIENGTKQRVCFEYRMEYKDQLVGSFSDGLILHMDTPESMTAALEAEGFSNIRIRGSYENIPHEPGLPGFVLIASKTP